MTNNLPDRLFFLLAFQLTIVIMVATILQFGNASEDSVSIDSNTIKNSGANNKKVFNISNNTGHSELPQIVKNGNNIYVMWIDDTSGSRDLYFKRSSDNGCTFTHTIDLGIEKGGALDPKIAISGTNVYVTWEQTPGNNGAIFLTRSTDNGATFETVKNLGNNTGFNGFPQIALSGNNVYVVWHDATNGILFARSTDNGATFETVKNLGNNTGFNGFPQIAVSGNNVYVVWTNNFQEKYGQIFFTRSNDNGDSFENPSVLHGINDDSIGNMIFSPRITAEPRNNNVYVVWHSGRVVQHANVKALISDIFFTRSTDNGTTFGDIMNLSNYSGWSVDPQIAVSQNNNVYVVWTNNFQEKYGQIFFRTSTDNGTTLGDIMNLSNYSGWSVDPQIAVSQNNNVYVVWTNNATGNEEIIFKKDIINSNNCVSSNARDNSENLDNIKKADTMPTKAKNIAIVEATFTRAAYDKSFYMFFEIYDDDIRKTDNLSFTNYTDLLSSKVIVNTKNWSGTDQIVNHLKWLTPKSTIDVLGDEDVHNGSSLFNANGTNVYDVIMLQHQEYVSQQEYDNLKQFVANGGILMLLTGNIFYVEVEYDENTNTVKFVKGHGFAFNGKTAWRSDKERWERETSEWVGSNYKCCFSYQFIFRNDPFGITHVEEQYVTNPKVKILLDYNATINRPEPGQFVIATFDLEYKKGRVITLGIWTVNKLFENERFLRFFDSLLFQYSLRD